MHSFTVIDEADMQGGVKHSDDRHPVLLSDKHASIQALPRTLDEGGVERHQVLATRVLCASDARSMVLITV